MNKYESFFEEEEVESKKETQVMIQEMDDVKSYISEELEVNRKQSNSLKELN